MRELRTTLRTGLIATAVVAMTTVLVTPQGSALAATQNASYKSANSVVLKGLAQVPLSFEANWGQTNKRVRFVSRGPGYTLFLTPDAAVLSLRNPGREVRTRDPNRRPGQAKSATRAKPAQNGSAVVSMRLVGASPNLETIGVDKLPGRSNYLIGRDHSKWRTNVPRYAKVRYEEIYSGIDLVFYGQQRQLEYDFIIAPGADPKAIALRFEGATQLGIDDNGELVLHTPDGELRLRRPLLYQAIDGVRHEVQGKYVLDEHRWLGFEVANYDTGRPLIIDPVLSYATYLGGSDHEWGYDIAVDDSGNAYVTGLTASLDFPIAGAAEQVVFGGEVDFGDAFVTKVNADGTDLIYSTYLGGAGADAGEGIAVDTDGNAYVTGWTASGAAFPTTPFAFEPSFLGGVDAAFVTKLNPIGNLSDFCLNQSGAEVVCSDPGVVFESLPYSTFLSGSQGSSFGFAIDVDTQGNAYVVGNTSASDFPTTPNAFQTTAGDAFVTKLNATGSDLLYSTYLSVNGETEVNEIAVDATGNAHVVGTVWFPWRNEDNTEKRDGFVAKYDTKASGAASRVYISGLAELGPSITGSRRITFGYGVAVDATSNVYLTGSTRSPESFPTTENAFQTAFGGGKKCSRLGISCPQDAFVMKLDSSGALVCSTYLGGREGDTGWDIAVDGTGDIYVTGRTNSRNFPLQSPFQGSLGGGAGDAFVAKLNAECSGLVYSSYLGGAGNESGQGIAVDHAGSAYVAGGVSAQPDDPSDLSTPSAFQPFFGGGSQDAFVAKISD